MAITIRKDATLKTLGQLEKKLNIKTKAGVIDYIVERHLGLVENLNTARERGNNLEKELFHIKRIIKQNTESVHSFARMCKKINNNELVK